MPKCDQLRDALRAAGRAHHDYERAALEGRTDTQGPGFHAAYVLGQLGWFAAPTALAGWPESTPETDDWSGQATTLVLARVSRP